MIRRLVIAALALGVAQRASACAVCFGDPGSDQTQALMVAMAVLLGLVAAVLTTIVVVAVRISRRAAALDGSQPAADAPAGAGAEG